MIFKHIAKKYQEKEHIKIYILMGFIILVFIFYFSTHTFDQIYHSNLPEYGLTYSPGYANALGLDPKTTYQKMFLDFNLKKVRLSAYWDEIEPGENKYDFTSLDYYISEAEKNNAEVVLTIGYKLPRWPECRVPKWLEGAHSQKRQEEQLKMLGTIISYYEKINPKSNIMAFQLENEPFLPFGTCDPVDEKFFRKEVGYVRSKTNLPIILTDSGELSSWILPMQFSDYFGTTMYRVVESPFLGTIPYYFQPWYYRIKSDLVRSLFAPNNKATIIIELQAEPWSNVFIAEVPIEEQLKYFNLLNFKNNIDFAKKTGFTQNYLWGVEWWYYIKNQGHPEYLDFAKKLLK